MDGWQVRLQIKVDGSVGDCQVANLTDSPIQPDSKVTSNVSSKVGQIVNVGFVGLVVPRHVPDHIRDVSEDSCAVYVVGKVLQDQDELFGDVCQANVAQSDVVGCISQIVIEQRIVQFVAVLMEVCQVIGRDVRNAARGDVKKMPGEVEDVLSDILCCVVP